MPKYMKSGMNQDEIKSMDSKVYESVRDIIDDITHNGDEAVLRYSKKFDNWAPECFLLSKAQIEEIVQSIPEQTVEDIKFAQTQIKRFAEAQKASMHDLEIETLPGVTLIFL